MCGKQLFLEKLRWGGEVPGGQVECGTVISNGKQRPVEVILPLCLSLVRQYLGWCVQSAASQYKKGIDILE